jgi:S1-C subfamily serine protease
VTDVRSKTTDAAAGILLLIFCFFGGGCLHDNNTVARREASFLPYADAKVGEASLREFMRARASMVFEGDQLKVTISGTDHFNVKGKISGIGSAAAIDRRGYFLTAAHCAGKETCLLLFRDKGQLVAQTAQVVWRGDESKKQPDLALLRVPLPLQDVFEWTAAFTNGERIVAAGINVLSNSVIKSQCMAGKILKLDTHSETVVPHYIGISHDAPLRAGDSGGPLVSTDGRLVGINADAVIGRPRWLSFSVETLSGDAERPDLDWLRQLIEQDAAAKSGGETSQFKVRDGNCGMERGL